MKKCWTLVLILFLPLLFTSCATSDKDFNVATVQENDEFDKIIKIEKIKEDPVAEISSLPKAESPKKKEQVKIKAKPQKKEAPKPSKKKQEKTETAQPEVIPPVNKPRVPSLEDDEGFNGRRPQVIPYRVGEELVMGISYFKVEAGKFTMQVRPMVKINGEKSYHFRYLIKTSPLFSMFYSVDDVAETFVDYDNLLPYSYEIHVNESKQVRETRTFFDHKKNKATMWDRKKRPNKPLEKRKIEWDILPYSQNVFSVAYYLRNFTLRVGKELKVRVGHEGKNIIMTAKVLRRETIYTDAGKFDTYVVKPRFDIDGKFKPTGENYLWLTADDRKFIVRMESKIKIGTIVGEVQKLTR
jgi:hypothetical protein